MSNDPSNLKPKNKFAHYIRSKASTVPVTPVRPLSTFSGTAPSETGDR